ncbi:TetR family transcriptional regulator [Bifidobacterium margollesii]|uniref:TetR family transcriptional regulator n=1 Tax=Bifidobacterium margollesii TaxID=2020964 RepID=A0A2N5J9T0_9BIFI|nr:TetR family transcriptional regulator [Bifidobacterium margollesii]PLS30974.1 TetR family transcriptional regulator [Bifidobacterium margollesii]
MNERSARRFDPERKRRIIDACLNVIAERGVAGTSHRVVASAADVPLGSMTYHFDGIDDLLHQAFERFADQTIDRFSRRMTAASNAEEACEQVARHIEHDLLDTQQTLNINLELYTLAARNPAYRDIVDRWMAASRTELERLFDPSTAMVLDALIEGLTLHRALGRMPQDPRAIREGIRRVAGLDRTTGTIKAV